MTKHDATEIAYKNGYADGFEAGRQSVSIEFTSVWLEAEDESLKVCFKLRDREHQVSIPFNREEIRIWLTELDKSEHEQEREEYESY